MRYCYMLLICVFFPPLHAEDLHQCDRLSSIYTIHTPKKKSAGIPSYTLTTLYCVFSLAIYFYGHTRRHKILHKPLELIHLQWRL